MTEAMQGLRRVPNVRLPVSLVSDPTGFGGVREQAYLCGDLVCRGGRAVALLPAASPGPARLILPRLTEPHAHLDKCHTVDRLPAVGGDLRAAIEVQRQDKGNWTRADLQDRARRGLQELIASGCGAVRSHVDWGHGQDASEPPPAWHVLKELAEEYRGVIDLQLAALASLEDLADPVLGPAIAQEVAAVDGALGAFVLDHAAREAGIEAACRLAATFGTRLDFHVDEGLAQGLDGLQIIARTKIAQGFDGPVLCGHACSLMNLTGDDLCRTVELIYRAGLSVVTLPGTNLYLQGRSGGTPDRRGLTRVQELRGAGVTVCVGTDNVRDAFCPVGRHDPRQSLALAVLAGHLDPPLADLWPMITTDAQRALGLPPVHIDGAPTEDLLVLTAPTTTGALASATPPQPLTMLLERTRR